MPAVQKMSLRAIGVPSKAPSISRPSAFVGSLGIGARTVEVTVRNTCGPVALGDAL